MKVAAIQTYYDKSFSKELILAKADSAVALGAKLIVLPELCHVSSYEGALLTQDSVAVELSSDPWILEVRKFAHHKKVFIILPVFEKREGEFLSSVLLISDQGEVLGVVRKPLEGDVFFNSKEDSGFEVFRTSLGRIGITLARGATFFKQVEEMVLMERASWIIHPQSRFSSTAHDSIKPESLRHSKDLGYGLILVNRTGVESKSRERWSGGSALISSHGKIISQATQSGDEIIFAEMEKEEVRVRSSMVGAPPHPSTLNPPHTPSVH